jgi:DNA-binding NtrC family response regulator
VKISSMKILMVHADKDKRGQLAIMLARFDHSVTFADGIDLSALKLDTYDLIIVDEYISDGSGYVFLKKLSPKYRAKSILMSGDGEKEREFFQHSIGIYECMKKPVKPMDLAVVTCNFFVSFYLNDESMATLSC